MTTANGQPTDDDLLKTIAEGVHRREYSLLLGAGASIGSIGGDNQPLPSGPQLRDTLVRDFRINNEDHQIDLSRAYAAAKRKNAHLLEQFIRQRFTRCTPDWHHILTEFDWHRIWTLNIDDTVEQAYESRNISVDRFNWTSTFRDTSTSQHQIIHLHGFAKPPSTSDTSESEIVFSMSQYIAALRDPRAWHAVFTDEFADRPMLVLGASLYDEFDLHQALHNSSSLTTRGFPSIIVLTEFSQLEREEFESYGLTVIRSDAASFMSQVHQRVMTHRKSIRTYYDRSLDAKTARFLQQFIDLRQYRPQPTEGSRHFYEGYEPQWRNILDEDDAILETTVEALDLVRADVCQPECHQAVHVLTGRPGTGKSTGLLRIARELIADGLFTFQFRGDEDPDIEAISEWLRRTPNTVLIFNDCADFAVTLGHLAEECESAGINLIAVGSERSARLSFLRQKISDRYLQVSNAYEYSVLSDDDIISLVDKLASRRRLGHITRQSKYRRYSYFRRTASRRIFEGMAGLEGGQGFRDRIRSDYLRLRDENLKRLYAVTSIAFQYGYPIPIGIAAKAAGLPPGRATSLIQDYKQDVLWVDTNGLRLPHRLTATLVVDSALTPDDTFDAMYRLALAIAPHIDIKSLRSLSRPYRILRILMNQEAVSRRLGEQNGRRFYELLQQPYDWNGRYWDQRALFESSVGNHAQARSYAEFSLHRHRHPFAFNTLGTVLGRSALDSGDAATLREAVNNLMHARETRRWEESEHPYVTFFRTLIRFGQDWGLAAIPTQLRNAFHEWHRHAIRSTVFAGPRNEELLEEYLRDWLYLSTQ